MTRKRRTERDRIYKNLIREHGPLSNKELIDRARRHPTFEGMSREAVDKDVDRWVGKHLPSCIKRVDGRLEWVPGSRTEGRVMEKSEYDLAIKHSRSLFALPLTETAKSEIFKTIGRKERIPLEERLDELLDSSNPERRKKSHLWQHIQSGYSDLAKSIEEFAPENIAELIDQVEREVPAETKFGGLFLPGDGAALKKILKTGQRPKLSSTREPDPSLASIRDAFFEIYETVRLGRPIRGSCSECEGALPVSLSHDTQNTAKERNNSQESSDRRHG